MNQWNNSTYISDQLQGDFGIAVFSESCVLLTSYQHESNRATWTSDESTSYIEKFSECVEQPLDEKLLSKALSMMRMRNHESDAPSVTMLAWNGGDFFESLELPEELWWHGLYLFKNTLTDFHSAREDISSELELPVDVVDYAYTLAQRLAKSTPRNRLLRASEIKCLLRLFGQRDEIQSVINPNASETDCWTIFRMSMMPLRVRIPPYETINQIRTDQIP